MRGVPKVEWRMALRAVEGPVLKGCAPDKAAAEEPDRLSSTLDIDFVRRHGLDALREGASDGSFGPSPSGKAAPPNALILIMERKRTSMLHTTNSG